MSTLYLPDIQENALQFCTEFTEDGFIYELLAVYGISKANITKMRQSQEPYILNNKVNYLPAKGDLEVAIEELKNSPITKKKKSRFLVTTDFKRMRAVDTKTGDTLDVAIEDFFEDYGFFLPWTGREKVQVYKEVEADQKAAQKMAKLFEIIRLDNPSKELEDIEALNHFFSRLIFCYYAEDTGIFKKNTFTGYIENYTDYDGSNTAEALRDILRTLSHPQKETTLKTLMVFPYVNGGLFEKDYKVPDFSSRARRMLIECGKIKWSKINPDIFGSMFQGVMDDDIRHELGAHYTSVPNIMKVINPLFMDELKEEFEKNRTNKKALKDLHDRISRIKIFDPACGSGNFLITAYKELRYLEMQILEAINKITGAGQELGPFSIIEVNHFYGIELNPFAVELAKLSMWLAEHQMNIEFQHKFTTPIPSIPLRDSANIVAGNACRLDWNEVCPLGENVYVLGNPPYMGYKNQRKEQRKDMAIVFSSLKDFKKLDYVACWLQLAINYIDETNGKCGFVTTSSICQGELVSILWGSLLDQGVKITFAHRSFKWENNAINSAGVSCIVIGFSKFESLNNFLISDNHYVSVKNINPYLIDAANTVVLKRKKPLASLPCISDGSGALDGGHLILSEAEKKELEENTPQASKFIRRYLGSNEYINDVRRWCLWIEDDDLDDALNIVGIRQRIDAVRQFRENAGTRAKTALNRSHKFAWINQPKKSQIIIPTVSSERREYIPMGFLESGIIVSNSANIIHDPKPYVLGLVLSRMHMVWVKAVAGRLEDRIRYTSAICYNTFPIPHLNEYQMEALEEYTNNILDARDMHPGKTLANLYNPDKMPQNLRNAHNELDLAVDKIYRKEPFRNDEERLTHLFKLYEEMTAGEKK